MYTLDEPRRTLVLSGYAGIKLPLQLKSYHLRTKSLYATTLSQHHTGYLRISVLSNIHILFEVVVLFKEALSLLSLFPHFKIEVPPARGLSYTKEQSQ